MFWCVSALVFRHKLEVMPWTVPYDEFVGTSTYYLMTSLMLYLMVFVHASLDSRGYVSNGTIRWLECAAYGCHRSESSSSTELVCQAYGGLQEALEMPCPCNRVMEKGDVVTV